MAAVVAAPMLGIMGILAGDKLKMDALAGVGALLSFAVFVAHIVVSCKLAYAIVAERATLGRSASAPGLIIGLLFGGWAAMFAVFFCGCLVVMMTA